MINKLYTTFTLQRILFIFSLLLIFFFFETRINNLIGSYFASEDNFSSGIIDIIFIIGCLVLVIYCCKKFFIHSYQASYNEVIFCFLLVLLFSYYLLADKTRNWRFSESYFLKVKYIIFVVIPPACFLIAATVRFFQKYYSARTQNLENNYLDDSPITTKKEDQLNYSGIVSRLKDFITSHAYKKSFTIGLVGPWGNGKSSVINMIIEEIRPTKKSFKNLFIKSGEDDIIIINFLPYLNHKEDEIIAEFFNSLSSKLSSFSGKLSEQIINYSNGLSNFYKDNSLGNLFELGTSKLSHVPSKQLYDEINYKIAELNKKIIVFVDDLDRLNDTEILQVLKLIRNTADFANTIFVVAMDKEYVINRLKASNKILDSKYIDKFFQLEIYMPELDSSSLRTYFRNEIIGSKLNETADFESLFNAAFYNKFNLFDDYIKNIRDIKRVVNQIIFEYPQFEKELDLKDFMNFIYLKLRYPKLLKILNDSRDKLLELDNSNKYYVLKRNKNKKESSTEPNERIKDLFFKINEQNFNIDKYEIYNEFELAKFDISVFTTIDRQDLKLLVKTLAALFGDENEILSTKSIKFENNFRKLITQKFLDSDFRESEFEALFLNSSKQLNPSEPYELPMDQIETLFEVKKIHDLVERFKFFNTKDREQVKWTMLILSVLYNSRERFNLQEKEIFDLLDNFVTTLFELSENEKKGIGGWIFNNIIDQLLSPKNRLLLIGQIWESNTKNKNWGLSEQLIKKYVVEVFEIYLNTTSNDEHSASDYSVYGVYHSIKDILNLRDKISKIFVTNWFEPNIELFCAQIINLSSFTTSRFTISEVVEDFFGSKDNFVNTVKASSNQEKGMNELKKFFGLSQITLFSEDIVFEFRDSFLMINKIERIRQNESRNISDEKNSIRQLFLVSNDDEVFSKALTNSDIDFSYDMRKFEQDSLYYLRVNLRVKDGKKGVSQFIQSLLHKIIPTTSWEQKSFSVNSFFKNEPFYVSGEKYLKVFSIESKIS